MVKIIKLLPQDKLMSYILMRFITAQETPSLMAYKSTNGDFAFKILPKSNQEISYFGNLNVVSPVHKKNMKFKVLSQEYGTGFVRTKSSELLYGSFGNGVAAMDSYYV